MQLLLIEGQFDNSLMNHIQYFDGAGSSRVGGNAAKIIEFKMKPAI